MKKLILLLGLGLMATYTQAQQIPLYSNYFFTPYIYNPALSGTGGVTEATILHRRQWSGIQGSPETSALAVNGAMNDGSVGWSVYGFSDKTDILSRLGVYGNYAYHVQLTKDISLSGGLGAGYINQTIDQSGVRARDAGDVFTVVAPNRGTFDMNLGLSLMVRDFTLGFAAPQIFSESIVYATNPSDINYNLIRHYVVSAQYDFKFAGDKQILSPMAMVRAAEGVPVQIDAGLLYNMVEYGYVGAMYRSSYGVTANIGLNLSEQLTLGYAYDFSTNTYASSFGTSHEFMLTYRFGSNKENERLENEVKRIKHDLRRQRDETEETIDEKIKEFKDNYKDELAKSLEEEKKKMEAELERMRQDAQNNAPNNQTNNGGNQGGNQGGNTMRDLQNQRDQNMNNNPNNNYQPDNNNPNTGNTGNTNPQDYAPENRASNVSPGSPGYYVTAGVFGEQGNATRLKNRLNSQGIDAQIFQDPSNNFFYVYLYKFTNYQQADQAKSSRLNGSYTGDLWIKIVK
ncbi:PorP/SprF family type IX secretion system membrane protein [Croceimicrobium hydrocarbonivorans]|uniref:PorP/SprF family type IX secretion system membrane protein n=1 Tax=Croceimicrobium hydrocarbonivorans TaxID=2761580 RepID=A0A7H0VFC8_9FLAO|nr:type IX secretion system membrane protein PorP/SprF [Croceimicrobium hydrocarbonivorans]QNR24426.1 PorP/SprF family type IX secretion system membrane protein [Croceimicrobium hydrocarbonivorans]